MKWFQIPDSVRVKLPQAAEAEDLSFAEYEKHNVWCDPSWREDVTSITLYREIREARARAANPGDWCGLSDAAFEKYAPLATLRGKALPPVLQAFMAFIEAVMLATSKAPTLAEPEALPAPEDPPN